MHKFLAKLHKLRDVDVQLIGNVSIQFFGGQPSLPRRGGLRLGNDGYIEVVH